MEVLTLIELPCEPVSLVDRRDIVGVQRQVLF